MAGSILFQYIFTYMDIFRWNTKKKVLFCKLNVERL